ncbi:Hypothetical predicted protein [Mytilus galloprovincialis]|uniref:C1q domain-containing protein n=1 Tax=Mytilus galloprovincialis TaxID=29158 RepID=A0A8B6CKR9_MYTGA|nr:Hypothetical predicted protein [Mytilus galloprovincialis]
MPLLDNLEATLKADLDVRKLNSFIRQVVKKEVEDVMHGDMKKIMNKSVSNVENLSHRTNEMKLGLDSKFDKLKKEKEMQDEENTVLLSCNGKGGFVGSSRTILFQKVNRFTGISGAAVNKFKSDGKFVCETKGLYLIAANINTYTDGAWFKIIKNHDELTRTYISNHGEDSGWHSSTGVTYAMLSPLDTVYIQTGKAMTVSGTHTSLTIIKLK